MRTSLVCGVGNGDQGKVAAIEAGEAEVEEVKKKTVT